MKSKFLINKILVLNINFRWHKATNAKNLKNVKKGQVKQHMTFQQKQVMWSALISHLKTEV